MMERIPLPEKVKVIIERLEQKGFEAYAVGGCVRDTILGRVPGDWDLTTNALPEEIKSVFSHTIDTGIEHGTVTVMIGGEGFEVTTFRADGEYTDHRHPLFVTFVPNLKEDLSRRDFTINAMAYNDKTGIIDFFHGISDLKEKRIRCVGEPLKRFGEDALRMMRAVRFSAQLGFSIDPETENAIRILHGEIDMVSRERIQAELVRLFLSDHPDRFSVVYESGLCKVFLPEAASSFSKNICVEGFSISGEELILTELLVSEKILPLRMALLLSEIEISDGESKEQVLRNVLKKLKFDNRTLKQTISILSMYAKPLAVDAPSVRRFLSRWDKELFGHYLAFRRAKAKAIRTLSEKSHTTLFYPEREERELEQLSSIFEEVIARKDCVSLSDLAVTGKDLINLGITDGKRIGTCLKTLLELVLDHPAKNQKEQLLAYAQEHLL